MTSVSTLTSKSSPSSATTAAQAWICATCTLENPARRRRCEACGSRPPVVISSTSAASNMLVATSPDKELLKTQTSSPTNKREEGIDEVMATEPTGTTTSTCNGTTADDGVTQSSTNSCRAPDRPTGKTSKNHSNKNKKKAKTSDVATWLRKRKRKRCEYQLQQEHQQQEDDTPQQQEQDQQQEDDKSPQQPQESSHQQRGQHHHHQQQQLQEKSTKTVWISLHLGERRSPRRRRNEGTPTSPKFSKPLEAALPSDYYWKNETTKNHASSNGEFQQIVYDSPKSSSSTSTSDKQERVQRKPPPLPKNSQDETDDKNPRTELDDNLSPIVRDDDDDNFRRTDSNSSVAGSRNATSNGDRKGTPKNVDRCDTNSHSHNSQPMTSPPVTAMLRPPHEHHPRSTSSMIIRKSSYTTSCRSIASLSALSGSGPEDDIRSTAITCDDTVTDNPKHSLLHNRDHNGGGEPPNPTTAAAATTKTTVPCAGFPSTQSSAQSFQEENGGGPIVALDTCPTTTKPPLLAGHLETTEPEHSPCHSVCVPDTAKKAFPPKQRSDHSSLGQPPVYEMSVSGSVEASSTALIAPTPTMSDLGEISAEPQMKRSCRTKLNREQSLFDDTNSGKLGENIPLENCMPVKLDGEDLSRMEDTPKFQSANNHPKLSGVDDSTSTRVASLGIETTISHPVVGSFIKNQVEITTACKNDVNAVASVSSTSDSTKHNNVHSHESSTTVGGLDEGVAAVFSTAGKRKPIRVSQESTANAERMWQSFHSARNDTTRPAGTRTGSLELIGAKSNEESSMLDALPTQSSATLSALFCTAGSSIPITTSAASMETAERLLQTADIEAKLASGLTSNAKSGAKFLVAGTGKAIAASKASLIRVRRLLTSGKGDHHKESVPSMGLNRRKFKPPTIFPPARKHSIKRTIDATQSTDGFESEGNCLLSSIPSQPQADPHKAATNEAFLIADPEKAAPISKTLLGTTEGAPSPSIRGEQATHPNSSASFSCGGPASGRATRPSLRKGETSIPLEDSEYALPELGTVMRTKENIAVTSKGVPHDQPDEEGFAASALLDRNPPAIHGTGLTDCIKDDTLPAAKPMSPQPGRDLREKPEYPLCLDRPNPQLGPSLTVASFATAGKGSTIFVSERSLSKAEQLFTTSTSRFQDHVHHSGREATGKDTRNVTEGETESDEQQHDATNTVDATKENGTFIGPPSIAEKVLHSAVARKHDHPEDELEMSKMASDMMVTFSTAGKAKSIPTSESRLDKATELLGANASRPMHRPAKQLAISRAHHAEADVFISSMFATAGRGKSIYTSERSMARADEVLQAYQGQKPERGIAETVKAVPAGAMAVSFSTAGKGTSIFVSETNLAKAKRLLERSTCRSEDPSQQPEKHPIRISAKTSMGQNSQPIHRGNQHQAEENVSRSSICAKAGKGSTVIESYGDLSEGFASAGKVSAISLSDTSLAKVGHLLEAQTRCPVVGFATAEKGSAIEDSETSLLLETDTRLRAAGCATAWKGDAISFSKESLVKVDHLLEEDSHCPVVGFATAGKGAPISVSETSLTKAGHLLEGDSHCPVVGFATAGNSNPISVSETSLTKAGHLLKGDSHCPVVGFATAGKGAPISVSETSLTKAGHLLEGDSHCPVVGFATAGNSNPISVSETSLTKAGHLLKGDSHYPVVGFATAGKGNPISVSETSLTKAGHLLKGDSHCPVVGFATAGKGNAISVSETSLTKVGHLLEQNNGYPMVGFTTGGNSNAISVSETSLVKAGHLLEQNNQCPVVGFTTAGNSNAISVSETSLVKAGHLLKENSRCPVVGFTTAGKQNVISVSETSLAKAGHLLERNKRCPVVGFATAGKGNTISVSERSLEKAGHLLEQNNRCPVVGFATAGKGNAISVSDTSLEKAGHLLERNNRCPVVGFATAATAGKGNAISVSDTSLAKAGHLLEENNRCPVVGFATAGKGNAISVSETSLAKAGHLFKENNRCPVVGFATAGKGNVISVSETSLAKAEHLLEENNRCPVVALATAGKSSPISVSETAEHLPETSTLSPSATTDQPRRQAAGNVFLFLKDLGSESVLPREQGGKGTASMSVTFSTAGKGTKISVSETSMARAKKIFEFSEPGKPEGCTGHSNYGNGHAMAAELTAVYKRNADSASIANWTRARELPNSKVSSSQSRKIPGEILKHSTVVPLEVNISKNNKHSSAEKRWDRIESPVCREGTPNDSKKSGSNAVIGDGHHQLTPEQHGFFYTPPSQNSQSQERQTRASTPPPLSEALNTCEQSPSKAPPVTSGNLEPQSSHSEVCASHSTQQDIGATTTGDPCGPGGVIDTFKTLPQQNSHNFGPIEIYNQTAASNDALTIGVDGAANLTTTNEYFKKVGRSLESSNSKESAFVEIGDPNQTPDIQPRGKTAVALSDSLLTGLTAFQTAGMGDMISVSESSVAAAEKPSNTTAADDQRSKPVAKEAETKFQDLSLSVNAADSSRSDTADLASSENETSQGASKTVQSICSRRKQSDSVSSVNSFLHIEQHPLVDRRRFSETNHSFADFSSTPRSRSGYVVPTYSASSCHALETPRIPFATPHSQLVRWGSIRRVTYGLETPSSDQSDSPDDDLSGNEDQLVQVASAGKRKAHPPQRPMQSTDSTPMGTVHHIKRAKITLSRGEQSPLERRRHCTTEGISITPVPINFHEECSSDTSVTVPSDPLGVDITEEKAQNKDATVPMSSLRDAMSSGKMSNSPEDCLRDGVHRVTLEVDSLNAAKVRFDSTHGLPIAFFGYSDASNCELVGEVSDIRQALVLRGCDPGLLEQCWIENHMRWIVWKLASYERRFSSFLAGRHFSFEALVSQLEMRFSREIKDGRRPALRQILNRDAASTRLMILCVCQVFSDDGSHGTNEGSADAPIPNCKVELTDGWYSVQANLDKELSVFVRSGLIRVGTKLLTCNARLVGAEDGVDPLDKGYSATSDTCNIRLQLTANSTRLAKWNSKLGFVQMSSQWMKSSLGLLPVRKVSDIIPGGGNVPLIRLRISKVNPKLFLEKCHEDPETPASNSPVLTEAEEETRRIEFEKRKLKTVDKISESIAVEVEKEVDEMAPEIWNRLLKSASPEDFYEALEKGDKLEVSKWQEKRSILLRDRMQKEIEAELECDSSLIRESTPFLRIDVATYDPRSEEATSSEDARLTIWHPTDEQVSALKEGTIIQVQNASVRETKYDGMIQLTANSRTCIVPVAEVDTSCSLCDVPTARRFHNLFRVHVLSHKMPQETVGDTHSNTIIDTVAIFLRTSEHLGPAGKTICIYVTDESNLVARIQGCTLPTERIRNADGLLSFCGLRVLPFDNSEDCAVVQYCEESSSLAEVTDAAPRIEELRRWVSSPKGQDQKNQAHRYLKAKIPMWEREGYRTAVGYVVGLKVVPSSREKLHIEVDCGHFSWIQAWELPNDVLGRMLSTLSDMRGGSDRDVVALESDEELRSAELGVLGPVFRARGVLWRFQLRRIVVPTSDASICCDYIVTDVSMADAQALAEMYVPESSPESLSWDTWSAE